MNARSLAALVLMNVVLLAALVVTVFSPRPAEAQFGGGHQYMMISGEIGGRQGQAAIYIIDMRTSRAVAATFNSANRKFEIVGTRALANDLTGPIIQR